MQVLIFFSYFPGDIAVFIMKTEVLIIIIAYFSQLLAEKHFFMQVGAAGGISAFDIPASQLETTPLDGLAGLTASYQRA